MKKSNGFNGEKFVNWVKEKRFYIVLLCCIMAVSVSYFAADSLRTKAPSPEAPIKIPATPLPDLTNNYPPVVSTSPKPYTGVQNLPQPKTVSPQEEITTPKPASVGASTEADAVYKKREKTSLSYPINGSITTPHTSETLIYSKTLGDWRTHDGIDIQSEAGADVKAPDDGIIEEVYNDDMMGITIIIDHQNGRKSILSNLSNTGLVNPGMSVRRGDIVSSVGNTAISESADGAHLHFEVTDDGERIDPLTVLEN